MDFHQLLMIYDPTQIEMKNGRSTVFGQENPMAQHPTCPLKCLVFKNGLHWQKENDFLDRIFLDNEMKVELFVKKIAHCEMLRWQMCNEWKIQFPLQNLVEVS